jgi:hypothetical protein
MGRQRKREREKEREKGIETVGGRERGAIWGGQTTAISVPNSPQTVRQAMPHARVRRAIRTLNSLHRLPAQVL